MKFGSSILFDKSNSIFNVSFRQALPDTVELCLQIATKETKVDLKNIELIVDIKYVVPGQGKISKILSILEADIINGCWTTKSYLGEFLREVTVTAQKPIYQARVTLHADEFKIETQDELNEDKLMFSILCDNWVLFAENARRLTSQDLNTFIANRLNHIQEINGCSTFMIEYLLEKQIYKFWGMGVIEIDQVDLAQEAYVGGYNFINDNNLLIIQNYGEGKLA